MITVCIMSYRYGHLIAQAIESILSQTRPPDRVLIVDDGVGDVAPVARKYMADFRQLGIEATLIDRKRNLGIVDNFNDILMNSVRTPRVMFLGADNYLRPDTLEKLGRVEADIVSYDIALFGADAATFAETVEASEIKDGYHIWRFSKGDINEGNYIHGSSLYNADLAKQYGYRASGRWYTEEDWMLFRAMLGGGASHVHVPEPLLFYRRHKLNFHPIHGTGREPSAVSGSGRVFRAARAMLRGVAKHVYHSSLTGNRLISRALLERQTLRLNRPAAPSSDRFQVTVATNEHLPPLAWLGRREGHRFEFTIGPSVERFDRGFFEGVWDGDFARFDQIAPRVHFGSGALFEKTRVRFLPPKHPLEYLFLFRDKREKVDHISNSLSFCLAAGGAKRGSTAFSKVAETIVESTHAATRSNIYRYDPVVVEDDDFALLRVFHNNFSMGTNGAIRFAQPYLGRRFKDFRDYRAFVSGRIAALFANATHPARGTSLRPVASVSSGYDSPAVAVLAREQGCEEAVTITVKVGGVEDSGREIAEQLGFVVREFPHVMGRDIDRLPLELAGSLKDRAREFTATAGVGDDVTFLALEPALAGRVLLTGAWGDSIWAKSSDVPPGLPVRIRFGKSLTEYRLRLGFAHVPVPFLGGIFPRSIIEISNAAEMAPYSVAGGYDRPIPRRIVEGAGIDRKSFGFTKVATSPDPLNHAELWSEAAEHVMRRYAPASDPRDLW